jgi:hypothetical protein
MLATEIPRLLQLARRRLETVIMYIWTAPGNGASSFRRATGVSDDPDKAREAAEAALRAGQAGTAYIERVRSATATPTLSFSYVRTGIGWWARIGQADHVVWTPYTAKNGRQHTAGNGRLRVRTHPRTGAQAG